MYSREGYFGVYFPSCAATREINTIITLEWVHKQFVTRVHTSFNFLHDITNPLNDAKTKIFTHNPCVSLACITLCWWRHNQSVMTSQWPDNCDANTWQLISNSLDIDFIHGDIHGRSCKKSHYIAYLWVNIVTENILFCYVQYRIILDHNVSYLWYLRNRNCWVIWFTMHFYWLPSDVTNHHHTHIYIYMFR